MPLSTTFPHSERRLAILLRVRYVDLFAIFSHSWQQYVLLLHTLSNSLPHVGHIPFSYLRFAPLSLIHRPITDVPLNPNAVAICWSVHPLLYICIAFIFENTLVRFTTGSSICPNSTRHSYTSLSVLASIVLPASSGVMPIDINPRPAFIWFSSVLNLL